MDTIRQKMIVIYMDEVPVETQQNSTKIKYQSTGKQRKEEETRKHFLRAKIRLKDDH